MAVLAAVALAACRTTLPQPEGNRPPPPRSSPTTPRPVDPNNPNAGRYALEHDEAPDHREVPADILNVPDAVPRAEPRSRGGNAPSYSVFGKTYRVLSDARGYRNSGMASWYGKKFHGSATANGETYDMYQMTAAHKTLPLPSFVRVTRTDTGKSVIVRVNDRGPFHPGRIIDLSYAAAAKLDMLGVGSAPVEVVALDPVEPIAPSEQWLQVAAYADPINAVVMREQLLARGHAGAQILIDDENGGDPLHRVVLGPFIDEQKALATDQKLRTEGYVARWMRR
ncbi:septal ring lytic transglycosylase RlpA family protein [Sinimarinibacterium sp. NLF-5-8]|uniref:septal ring lytic transglycosylase RlpA family protein n=1 Tax=Sinimarinibacterium sp. NLF-5-8 TaxID=2698684 RepID=UPI00137BCECC|nr:septal ring lytic transglycosylase RlpA family protein [Sinimarinibacterium sp. NLF-5-8]QHS10521.1 septal ring lytic transglycosylase RlpA family protein [Sinimarinibacterium sp. NLF-5-8]